MKVSKGKFVYCLHQWGVETVEKPAFIDQLMGEAETKRFRSCLRCAAKWRPYYAEPTTRVGFVEEELF